MLVALAAPHRGATHIDVVGGASQGASVTVHGVFGTVTDDQFVADAALMPYSRTISGWEFDAFAAYCAAQGAPIVDGSQSWRNTDVVAFYSLHDLWDMGSTVPAE